MLGRDSAPIGSFRFSGLAQQIVVLAALAVGALALSAGVVAVIVCLSPAAAPRIAEAIAPRQEPPALPAMALESAKPPKPAQSQIGAPFVVGLAPASSAPENSRLASSPTGPSALSPAIAVSSEPRLSAWPPKDAPLPPPRPLAYVGPGASPEGPFDHFTAVYDLTAHTVYLPDGTRLEAHSGLGDRLDDPRHVDEPDRGATPPHLYDLTLREEPFHGVQALRLNPVGGEATIFGRSGLLAHTYMLGPKGDSNGCVSFKDYDAFLQAFQNGRVKRLAVVASLN